MGCWIIQNIACKRIDVTRSTILHIMTENGKVQLPAACNGRREKYNAIWCYIVGSENDLQLIQKAWNIFLCAFHCTETMEYRDDGLSDWDFLIKSQINIANINKRSCFQFYFSTLQFMQITKPSKIATISTNKRIHRDELLRFIHLLWNCRFCVECTEKSFT